MSNVRRWLPAGIVGLALAALACGPQGPAAGSAPPEPVRTPPAATSPAAPTAARPAATVASQATVVRPAPTAIPVPPTVVKPAPTATELPARAPRVIAVDPGHGGTETGAVHTVRGRKADLIEKNVNLAIALYLADDLRAAGYTPVLTRTEDTGVNLPPRDLNGDGVIDNDDDLQARVDIANNAGADLLLSIHNNGAGPARRGTTTYYSQAHPLGAQGKALAGFIQHQFIAGLRGAGYDDVIDEGISDDTPLGKPFGHLFVIGPKTPRVARAAKMPGALGETLFLTNDTEAALLATKAIQQVIALAYARGVDDYFAKFPE